MPAWHGPWGDTPGFKSHRPSGIPESSEAVPRRVTRGLGTDVRHAAWRQQQHAFFFLLFFFFFPLSPSVVFPPSLPLTLPFSLPSFFPSPIPPSPLLLLFPSFLLHTFIIDGLYFIFEFYGVFLSMLNR